MHHGACPWLQRLNIATGKATASAMSVTARARCMHAFNFNFLKKMCASPLSVVCRCSERGWCVRAVQDPASSPVCRCPGFFEGSSCAVTQPQHCPVMCSGLGQCREGGWCHCVPGRWGHGCTRDKAYNSSGGGLCMHGPAILMPYCQHQG